MTFNKPQSSWAADNELCRRSSRLQIQCQSTITPRGSQFCRRHVRDRPTCGRRQLEYRAALPAALASTATWNLAAHLVGAGLFLVGFSALVFVVTAIPAILVNLHFVNSCSLSCLCSLKNLLQWVFAGLFIEGAHRDRPRLSYHLHQELSAFQSYHMYCCVADCQANDAGAATSSQDT